EGDAGELRANRLEQRRQRRVDEEGAVAGVPDQPGDLVVMEADVGRVQDAPGARNGEVELEVTVCVPRERADPLAAADAETVEDAAEAQAPLGDLAPRGANVRRADHLAARALSRRPPEDELQR